MAKRLVKIAKELNVGTATIVEFLGSKGIVVENKPTAKIDEAMHALLLLEYSNSKEEKEKADKLVIGTRLPQEEQLVREVSTPTPPPAPTPPAAPAPTPPPVEVVEATPPPPAVVEETPVVEATPEKVVEEPKKEEVPEPKIEVAETKKEAAPEPKKEEKPAPEKVKVEGPKIGVKVVDKIDLTASKPAKAKTVSKPKEEKVVPPPAAAAPVENNIKRPEPEEMVRAKTPQLKGLKIMGKIDASKLKEKPKKDTKKAEDDRPKRKRKRKKITADNFKGDQKKRGGSTTGGKRRSDEVKQVSAKEIEDKIKATMARISGGKGNKRQKIRRDNRDNKREKQEIEEMLAEYEKIQVTEFISVSELAGLLDIQPTDIIMTCMNMGVIVSINQRLDAEIIELVAAEYKKDIEFISAEEQSEEDEEIVDAPEDLEPRAAIVTVMGHVDHGKTSLLDYIRSANVADGEAGGITQHIGAYEVKVKDKRITFLDTPGHEAFTAMRARGAKVTDVAIIIIAADDRIMPQTKEAISHAQAAGVPMVFAINKIDKDGANPTKIKEELSGMKILVEEWGGPHQSQDISAKTGLGIDDLLEKVILQSDLLELQANPKRNALGTVIEASLDKGRGYSTKMLVQNGTLKIGDVIVAGEYSGKVKAMFNEKNSRIKEAGPSTPVLLLGLNGAPQAGEKFKQVDSDQEARQIASKRQQIAREQTNRASKRISLDEIGRRLALGSFKELNLIIKGDVDGSVEALSDSLIKQSIESVQVNVIHKAVGAIAESDILLASASDAIIIGFQVRPSSIIRGLAEKEGVQIKTYSIIYEAIDEIRSAIEGMLEPTKEERVRGEAVVREVFKISKLGSIGGCLVTSGVIARNNHVRVIRDGIVIYPTKEGVKGEIGTLKRFKDDVKEVKNALECGILIKNFNDIKENDLIESYEIVEIKQTLDS